jgi:two-component system response regulator PilR (NtrC family)
MTLLPHVLLVEDGASYRQLVTSRIERLGATVSSVGDLTSAIAELEHEEFDLIVSDVHLPNGTGLDLLAFVQSRFPDLPFVLMSGVVDDDLRAEAILADAVYDKDVLLGELPTLLHGAYVAG